MKSASAILAELQDVVHDHFTGHVTLHCNDGQVVRYEVQETRRPGRTGRDVEITERHAAPGGREK